MKTVASPRVSVIMATYNGAAFIRQSIASTLNQTWTDFELIVVDDCSTDETAQVLSRIDDDRLRVYRGTTNVGVVASRNYAFRQARGDYVAMLDHDDLSRPARLAAQVAYLDQHPDTVVVGTAAHILDDNGLRDTRHPETTTPMLIDWLLLVSNPLICSSVMFRAAAVKGDLMREDYVYADDYDLYHRLRYEGRIGRLDERLTIYRIHSQNASRRYEDMMAANAVKVLTPAYETWFGTEAAAAASLIVRHLSVGQAVKDAKSLVLLHRTFGHLLNSFLDQRGTSEADRELIIAHAESDWSRVLKFAQREGIRPQQACRTLRSTRAISNAIVTRSLIDRLPVHGGARRQIQKVVRRITVKPTYRPIRVCETNYCPDPGEAHLPPTLFVVVDTEAEFDWNRPFARHLTDVTAIDSIERGQEILEGFGLKPIYVIDYPVASQQQSVTRLRRIADRQAGFIGAHLHPWTTPPFVDTISNVNSFPGNLNPDVEEQKLTSLAKIIEENFGSRPLFYKAGRYGVGPMTAAILARLGFKVDFSLLAEADLRQGGGPDLRPVKPVPYWVDGHNLLSLPMTRAHVGIASSVGSISEALRRVAGVSQLRLHSVLSRANILDTITLTPEGVTAAEQIRLIRTMLRRGHRTFIMHYHSPSLSPGHTPYVSNPDELKRFLDRLRTVCRYFLDDVGGMQGNPADLIGMVLERGAMARSSD